MPPPSGALARMKASWVEERTVQMRCLVSNGKAPADTECLASSNPMPLHHFLQTSARLPMVHLQGAAGCHRDLCGMAWCKPSSIGVIASFASMLVCTGLEFRCHSEALCAYWTDQWALRKDDDDDSPAGCLWTSLHLRRSPGQPALGKRQRRAALQALQAVRSSAPLCHRSAPLASRLLASCGIVRHCAREKTAKAPLRTLRGLRCW